MPIWMCCLCIWMMWIMRDILMDLALVPQYIEAIEEKDTQVGQMVDALKSRKNYANEDWLIMVSTDHGGLGTSHGGPSEEERTIFIVANGERVKHQIITVLKTIYWSKGHEDCIVSGWRWVW